VFLSVLIAVFLSVLIAVFLSVLIAAFPARRGGRIRGPRSS
jgi:hypothetical protein